MSSLLVRKAVTKDIDDILNLQSRYLYSRNKNNLNGKTGLLNNEISSEELKQCIQSDDSIVMVLENLNTLEISAYVLCYSFSSLINKNPKLIEVLQKNNYLQNGRNALLIEHIVVNSNIGAIKLLKELYYEAKDRFDDVFGEIMLYPVENTVSKRFFTFLNGIIVDTIEYEDNTIWNIYYSPVQMSFTPTS